MGEVVALPEEWLVQILGQCVGEAVPEVQLGRMTGPSTEVAVSLPVCRIPALLSSDGAGAVADHVENPVPAEGPPEEG